MVGLSVTILYLFSDEKVNFLFCIGFMQKNELLLTHRE
ncbi:histidine kinase [Bacillus cereus]|uniref:Histidine kinase n=1 Tax=Bacillus cereus TaxID=1396 RepID=A0A2B0LES1_BACCE|nr:histidine kinase [Bacillus cereus]